MEPRLLEDELDEFERALLRSARSDEPDVRAIARAAVALGVATSTLTVAAGSAAAGTVSAGSTAVGTFSKLGALSVIKWLSIGVVGGLVTTSGVEIARNAIGPRPSEAAAAISTAQTISRRPAGQSTSDLSPIPVPPTPADPIAEPPAAPPVAAFADIRTLGANGAADVPASETNGTPARSAPPKGARSEPGVSPESASPAAPPARATAAPLSTAAPTAAFEAPPANAAREAAGVASIAEETAMLERTRRALASGSASTALLELDTYDQRARARALGAEAAVLRVEALLQAGQRSSAVALAQRLLAAQPHGPHANRLRSIVASSPYLFRGSSLETQAR